MNTDIRSRGNVWIIVLALVSTLILLGFVFYYFKTNKLNSNKECINKVLGVTVTIPSDWECKSEDVSDSNSYTKISSDFFTILISNMGRGPYCNDSENRDNSSDSCKTTTFLENEKVNLKLYEFEGKNREIFGGVVPLNNVEKKSKTWISIMYSNMEKQNLKQEQRTELLNVLNSIKTEINEFEKNETYINSKHKYKISYPNEWTAFINEENDYDINLRLKSDKTPSRHGFSIYTIENPRFQTLKEMCSINEFKDTHGISCKENLSTNQVQIGANLWEKINEGDINLVPSYNIILGLFKNDKLYFIVNEGYKENQIFGVLESFEFIND